MRIPLRSWSAIAAGLLLVSCATTKAPTLQVQKLSFGKVGITGARVNVAFAIRNPNPEDLLIERFEYELLLNGRSLGRGYEPNPVAVKAFGEERVLSRFDLNFLKLPGAVRELLDDKEAQARARGKFYYRKTPGSDLKSMNFDSEAKVDLSREND